MKTKADQEGTTSSRHVLILTGQKSDDRSPTMMQIAKCLSLVHTLTAGLSRVCRTLVLMLAGLSIFSISSCSKEGPTLGSISVTDPTGSIKGQVTSVVVSTTVNVSVAVSNDAPALGVDWSLICGGSPVPGVTTNACGTINPVHVGSNINMIYTAPQYVPVGNTVTLTATSTNDPSESVGATVQILPQPVTIQFSHGFLPPSSIGVSQIAAIATAQIAATVTNDPDNSGVRWAVTCGSAACGSFSDSTTPSGFVPTTYTAPTTIPAGGTVTVTATSIYDSTKSISAAVAITPITVSISAQSQTVPVDSTDAITAMVNYDAASGGVNWSAPSCGSAGQCGSISPAQTSSGAPATYTAPNSIPSGGIVTIAAQSVTDPTKTATFTLTIVPPPPISVTVTPGASMVQPLGSVNLIANVANDFTNQGVTWQCPGNYCSTTTSTVLPFHTLFVVPGSATPSPTPVVVTATSIADPTKSGTAAVTIVPTIAVQITTQPATILGGVPATFSATVSNDIAPGGVDWTATGCPTLTCGAFDSGNPNAPSHSASGASITYTLPNNIPWATVNPTVTITATSSASLAALPVSFATAQISVMPVTYVRFVPFAPSVLPVGNATASTPTLIGLIAAAVNDSMNEGVDWTVSCSDASAAACGQFMQTPALAPTVANTVGTQPVFVSYGKTIHAASGQTVAYEPPTQMPAGGSVILTATSTADPSTSASQVVTITNNLVGPALKGIVELGPLPGLPVAAASVQLFVAGNTGYGSASTALTLPSGAASVTTAPDGSFSIPAGYICPSLNSLVYLVALQGQPGGSNASNNPQLGLITALGPCGGLSSSVPLIMNEATTVASVYALAPFTGTDYAHIGSSATNYNNGPNPSNATNYNNGLANAFATVNNLVDVTTGLAPSVTPASHGIVPQAEINTLADAVDTCATTAGGAPGDGSACDAFFRAANNNPPGGAEPDTANAPTNILQAVLEVAQVPSPTNGNSTLTGSPLYDLLASPTFTPPFLPILDTAPYDWSLALNFTGGGLEGLSAARPAPSSMAIDASGNVWIADHRTSAVTEFSNTGAALSPYATGTTSVSQAGGFKGGGLTSPSMLAIDPYGNAWVLNANSSLSVLDFDGNPLSSASSPFSGAGNPTDIGKGLAVDGSGNVWVAQAGSPGDVAEYAGYYGQAVNGVNLTMGAPLSPQNVGYVNGINNPNGAIAIDNTSEVWILNQGNYSAVPLSSVNGQWLDPGYPDQGNTIDPTSGSPANPPVFQLPLNTGFFGSTLAIDSTGDLFIPSSGVAGTIFELLAGGSPANFGGVGKPINTPVAYTGLFAPVVIDGANHLWLMARANQSTSPPQPVALAGFTASGNSLNANLSAPGLTAPDLSESGPIAITSDASGNVWVLSGANPATLTEFVGVAIPAVTPISVAVQKQKVGKTP